MNPQKYLLITRVENGWIIYRGKNMPDDEMERYVATNPDEAADIVKQHLEADWPEILEPESPVPPPIPGPSIQMPAKCPECHQPFPKHLPACSKDEVPF